MAEASAGRSRVMDAGGGVFWSVMRYRILSALDTLLLRWQVKIGLLRELASAPDADAIVGAFAADDRLLKCQRCETETFSVGLDDYDPLPPARWYEVSKLGETQMVAPGVRVRHDESCERSDDVFWLCPDCGDEMFAALA